MFFKFPVQSIEVIDTKEQLELLLCNLTLTLT